MAHPQNTQSCKKNCWKYPCMVAIITWRPKKLHSQPRWYMKVIGHSYFFLPKVIVFTLGVVLPLKVDESKFNVLPHLLSASLQ